MSCEVEGCRGYTTHFKPYCLDHVQLMPYVQGLRHDHCSDVRVVLMQSAKRIHVVAQECGLKLKALRMLLRSMPDVHVIQSHNAKYQLVTILRLM